eukprot:scaffold4372_cov397-Prasinococcus_capsulatus_cf.AAC.10
MHRELVTVVQAIQSDMRVPAPCKSSTRAERAQSTRWARPRPAQRPACFGALAGARHPCWRAGLQTLAPLRPAACPPCHGRKGTSAALLALLMQ